MDKQLLEILVAFENKYPPVMEKKVGDVSIPIKRKSERKVGGNDRETIIESAIQAADEDVEDTALSSEEITSKQLFNHF